MLPTMPPARPERAVISPQAAQRRTVFGGAYRPYDRWIRLNPRMNIDSLEIQKDRPSFPAVGLLHPSV